jgi:hypothetical protein
VSIISFLPNFSFNVSVKSAISLEQYDRLYFLSVSKIISPWRTGIDDSTVKFLEKTRNSSEQTQYEALRNDPAVEKYLKFID